LTHEDEVRALQRRAEAVLDAVLGAQATVAIPDGANTSNCGDCAMFLGLQEYVRRRPGLQVAFIGEWQTPKRSLARALPSDCILLFGGGNGFGDVWTDDQRCREEFIGAFPGHRVVLAPQSINFSTRPSLDRARRVLDTHPDVTLLCRDGASYEFAKHSFDVRVELCPDAAFLLGPRRRTTDPTIEILWLARTDHESVPESSPSSVPVPTAIEVSDWTYDYPVARYRRQHAVAVRATSRALAFTAAHGGLHRRLNPAIRRLYLSVARSRVLRGVNYLSRGRVVVTDRLHGHIFCTLLGIPHVVLPNTDGKVTNLLSTWTDATGLTQRCDSASEALAVAASIVSRHQRQVD
jgi:pyruvyl transferase EpsO